MLYEKKSTRFKVQGANFKNNQLYSCALYLVPCIFALMKILMVCLGNICRSPLAEGLLQDKAWKAGLKWSVESAGTNGYHTGEAPHPLSQKVARINGVDISKQRSRKFVAEDFHRFDKIYAMSDDVIDEMRRIAKKEFDEKKVDLLLNELFPGQNVDVPDPWYGPEPGFHEVFKMINEVCDVIIKKYSILNDQFLMSNFGNPEKK
jgi:protein-tyrosine phosphatase